MLKFSQVTMFTLLLSPTGYSPSSKAGYLKHLTSKLLTRGYFLPMTGFCIKRILLTLMVLSISRIAAGQTDPFAYINTGTLEVNPDNPEQFAFNLFSSADFVITCKDFKVLAVAAKANLCSDAASYMGVRNTLPAFNLDADGQVRFEKIGAEGVKIFRKQFPTYTDQANYCDMYPLTLIPGTCERGCMVGSKEKNKKCLPVCINGQFYGEHRVDIIGCWEINESCSTTGDYQCSKHYVKGPRCPPISNPNPSCGGLTE